MQYVDAGAKTNWLKKRWESTKALANKAIDKIESIIQGSKLDRKLVKEYLERSNALQKQLDELMVQYEQSEDEKLLKSAQEAIEELKKEQEALLVQAKKELSAKEFQRLKEAIDSQQMTANQQVQKSTMIAGVYNTLKGYGFKNLEKSINAKNPYASMQASVKQGAGLSDKEKSFLKARKQRARKALNEYFGQDLAANQEVNIAFSGSGGGYRAMILTLGYLMGLEKLGLLDATLYASALSGSTWALAPWIQTSNNLNEQKDFLIKRIQDNKFDITSLSKQFKQGLSLLVNDIFWPKLVFGQPIGSIDIYGALLTRVLLANFGDQRLTQHISDQWEQIEKGDKPLPIYTSVSMHKDDKGKYQYNWYEFNPIEIRNHNLELSIPSYAFGWPFENGVATSSWPASLGYLMGIFGSAYNVNPKDLRNIITQDLDEASTQSKFEAIKNKLIAKALKYTSELPKIGTLRVSPAQVNNPFKGMKTVAQWLSDRDYLVFVDGGIDYNIPLRPLAKKERKINAIIIGDSSASIEKPIELNKAFKDLKNTFGYNYTRVDDRSTPTLHLYKDPKNTQAPRIIYINFLKDNALLEKAAASDPELAQIIDNYKLYDFNIEQCLAKEFCSTFNFDYSVQEFLQLLYLGMMNIVANKDKIEQFLRDEFSIK